MRIGVVAPAGRLQRETAEQFVAFASAHRPDVTIDLHPQCFASHGHFAGTDAERLEAFVAFANDPAFDAIWFARGGYGSNRIAAAAVDKLGARARDKAYLGYSDLGYLLAALYKAGFPHVAHGPMPYGISHADGSAAVARGLDWLAGRSAASLEPSLEPGVPAVAFNLTVLGTLLGTALEPDLTDHVLMIEDVGEMAYRIDRAMSHLTGQPLMRKLRGIRAGRFEPVPANDPPFGQTPVQIVRHWCERARIPFLGTADIGHDAANKVVPFGTP